MKYNDCTGSEFGDRLVPLCDGRPGLRAGVAMDIRDVSGKCDPGEGGLAHSGGPVLDFIASSEALDRYDEIIMAGGWRLENYRRNPVFQNAHQYGDIIFTLGRALITEVRAGKLFQRVEFATEANPMARIAYGLYRGGFLNAVSVGFIPIRWETGNSEDGFRRRYQEQELLEVSAVGIPANPEALQLGLKSGAIARSDLFETLELLRRISAQDSNEAVSNTLAGASGVRGDEARLLGLARETVNVIRGIKT